MAPDNLFMAGVELMLVGMATVFAFLTALVGATSVMSRVAARWDSSLAPPPAAGAAPGGDVPDARTLAVISAALHTHRNRSRQGDHADD